MVGVQEVLYSEKVLVIKSLLKEFYNVWHENIKLKTMDSTDINFHVGTRNKKRKNWDFKHAISNSDNTQTSMSFQGTLLKS